MSRKSLAAVLGAAVLFVVVSAGAASAHVTIGPGSAPKGGSDVERPADHVLPALGDLIRNLIAERTGGGTVDLGDSTWLFPGPRRGQPLSSRKPLRSLTALGVPATIGRNTALMELAGEMPAAVISGLLGINLQRATVRTQDAGNTRPGYAAEVARRASHG